MVRIDARLAAAAVDWNADGTADTSAFPQDVNFNGRTSRPDLSPELLAGSNDWASIVLNQVGARRSAGGLFSDSLGRPSVGRCRSTPVEAISGEAIRDEATWVAAIWAAATWAAAISSEAIGRGDLGTILGRGDLGRGDLGGGDLSLAIRARPLASWTSIPRSISEDAAERVPSVRAREELPHRRDTPSPDSP